MSTQTDSTEERENLENGITVGDGKYRLFFRNYRLFAERYGSPWRDLVGDGLVLALGQEIENLLALRSALAAENDALRKALEEISKEPTSGELIESDYEEADFESAYDHCVRKARAALARSSGANAAKGKE